MEKFRTLGGAGLFRKKHPTYPLGLRTLYRRLRYFDIIYVRDEVDLGQVKEAIRKEMNGPGKLLGY